MAPDDTEDKTWEENIDSGSCEGHQQLLRRQFD